MIYIYNDQILQLQISKFVGRKLILNVYVQVVDNGSFGGFGNCVQYNAATFRPARTSNGGQYMEGSPYMNDIEQLAMLQHQWLSLLEELLSYKMN